jgi:hypothetical protein
MDLQRPVELSTISKSCTHIHDPARFVERARPVLQVYARALSLLREGTWLLCLDVKNLDPSP